MRAQISVDLLRRLVRYEPDTGELFWLPRTPDLVRPGRNGALIEAQRFNAKHAGRPALNHLDARGYRVGALGGRYLAAHRAAWALLTGEWPRGPIDHINGDRSDNRFCNLRDATAAENARNAGRRRDNKSGRTGVYWASDKQCWGASIRFERRIRHLGFFDTVDAAAAARAVAERELGFHPNHGRAA